MARDDNVGSYRVVIKLDQEVELLSTLSNSTPGHPYGKFVFEWRTRSGTLFDDTFWRKSCLSTACVAACLLLTRSG